MYRYFGGLECSCSYLVPERIYFYFFYMARDSSIKNNLNPFQGTEMILSCTAVFQGACQLMIYLLLGLFLYGSNSKHESFIKESSLVKPEHIVWMPKDH